MDPSRKKSEDQGQPQRSKAEPQAVWRGQGQEEGRRGNTRSWDGTDLGDQVPLKQDQPVTVPVLLYLGSTPRPLVPPALLHKHLHHLGLNPPFLVSHPLGEELQY